MILGSTIFARTYDRIDTLHSSVSSTWGTQQVQMSPTASYSETREQKDTEIVDGKTITRTKTSTDYYDLPLESSRVNVALDLNHRQKGLLWYSTYKVDFDG